MCEVCLSRNTVPSKALHKATLSRYLSVILSDVSVSCWRLFASSNEVLNANNARVCAQLSAIFRHNWAIKSSLSL